MAWKSQEIKNEEKKIEPQTIKKSIVETKTEKTIALDDLSWLDKKVETIMIFGASKSGKTYSVCSYIEDVLKNSNGKIYYISTDKGFPETAKKYFGSGIKELFINRFCHKSVYTIDEMINYYDEIKNILNKEDLIVIDLLSDFWEWTQIDFIKDISRGKVKEYVQNASRNPKTFGLMEGSKWQYVKALNKFVEEIIIKQPCNFIGVCIEKDTTIEKIKGKEKTEQKLEDMGFGNENVKPGGQPMLAYKFETLVRIAKAGQKYYCNILGDRGHNPTGKMTEFGNDLKSVVDRFREEN